MARRYSVRQLVERAVTLIRLDADGRLLNAGEVGRQLEQEFLDTWSTTISYYVSKDAAAAARRRPAKKMIPRQVPPPKTPPPPAPPRTPRAGRSGVRAPAPGAT